MPSIHVGGMSCQHCVQSVTRALSAIPGITDISVSLERGEATFQAPKDLDWDAVRAAIAKAGFEPGKEEA
ncbi:MAG: Heavy metal transport/detoxification protein [Desulfomicrobiaceae bacterium]|nr:heavy-metal-associated domain-containing protein [Desulfomicrobiaceae bacterium]MBZ4649094.1 Heavy metal transport/detoxification protein [Desulfomicrobiaceae bacterium]MBZ4684751.1 Heavy metal transport/detoxification protein [Desulfomicrobiaceae bacterium]MDI3493753.1 copper chaperone [Desulfomicrobiaceae bacterium]MDK2873536.1 copper chaperone [Desulfomicrobiaceae bacterium]